MAVVAFVDGSDWDRSVIEYAAWATNLLGQRLTLVAQEDSLESQPPLSYDAYQQMNPREDMFRELATVPLPDHPDQDSSAIEIVQSAARHAKELNVERVRTLTTSDSLPYFVENSTDSEDLLVVPRRDDGDPGSRQLLDQFLKLRKRVMLLVPESFTQVESWLFALDGKPATGKAVDFLSNQRLLKSSSGTAVFVGSDYQNRIHFRDAVKHLHGSGHDVTSYELQGSADDVIAAVLTVLPVDMLVMGAYGQGRFRLLTERSTTSRLLREFRGPVLVARA